jgi:GT2 family glycosyltransferase
MIKFVIPWNSDKNIGKSYNDSFKDLPEEYTHVCFQDADCAFTTSDFGAFLERVVNNNPEYDLFTCFTNRVFCKWQLTPYVDNRSNDYAYARRIGRNHRIIYGESVEDHTQDTLLSGMLMIISRSAYEKIGGLEEKAMLGIDNDLHKRVREKGMKVGLIKGEYVYHYYSNYTGEGTRDISHLK